MERESQFAEEMGEEYHPLMGLGGGDELFLIWEPVRDVVGQVSGSPQFLVGSLHDRGDCGSPGLGGVRIAGQYLRLDTWTMKIQD